MGAAIVRPPTTEHTQSIRELIGKTRQNRKSTIIIKIIIKITAILS